MDEMNEQLSANDENIEELSHTDKMVGVFTEPNKTFSAMSKFAIKNSDWLIPIVVLIIVSVAANLAMMSNPVIKATIMEKSIKQIEKNLKEAVESGRLSEEQADEQLEKIRDNMERTMGSPILSFVGPFLYTFITFFIISGVFFLFAKFALGGEGTYSTSMVAYGLPHYIMIVQTIILVILALSMDKPFRDLSLTTLLDYDRTTIVGFLLGRLDVFAIWFYSVVSIAYARLFKSESTGKYFAMIFGLWIGFGFLMFLGAKFIPFLRGF